MDEKIVHYQVYRNGRSGSVYKIKDDAIEEIALELENDMYEFSENDETAQYEIKAIMMTPEEFKELPEFDGW